jgi:truncated hemoglobin YjbI
MIELLFLVQTVTTAALALVTIKLRRELWPAIATAGPVDAGFWIRSIDVLVLKTPQFETAKTVIKVRWLLTEELYLRRRFRVYDVAMHPSTRRHYTRWKAWLNGDSRYRCLVDRPRLLARLYNKAIDVFCFDREEERKFREKVQKYLSTPTKYRKRRHKRWRKPRPRRERATLYDLVEKFENK